MASGGDGDGDDGFFPPPTPPFQKTRRPSTLLPDTEESVTQQAEDVFRSYAYHRFQTEVQHDAENGLFTPAMPEIMECQQNPLSPSMHVGRQLAILGDDINRRYEPDFQRILSQLQLTPETAHQCFNKVAEGLFADGVNWGRIIALMCFGYRLAVTVFERGMRGFFGRVVSFVTGFLRSSHTIALWIVSQGGWMAVMRVGNSNIWMFGAIITLTVLFVVLKNKYSSS